MYTLENKIFYPVKLPLINRYKDSSGCCISSYWEILSFLSQEKHHSNTSDFNMFLSFEIQKNWFEINSKYINRMRELIAILKNNSDSVFYGSAFIFSCGVTYDALRYHYQNIDDVYMTSAYILDLSYDTFSKGFKIFGDDGFKFYATYLPTTFTAWPDVLNSSLTDAEIAKYTDSACALFEFIILRANFSYWNSFKPEHNSPLKIQILSYYKWLKSKNIFLPQKLQKLIAEFPFQY